MKPIYGFLIFIVLLAVILGVVWWQNSTEDEPVIEETPQSVETTPPTQDEIDQIEEADEMAGANAFTAEEVATHNSSSDCWTIIDGQVYDITTYIPRHPGGAEILAACGTDGSSLFNERQTETGETVGSGTPHSSTASSILEDFRVGEVLN